jgi:hypothetical protein
MKSKESISQFQQNKEPTPTLSIDHIVNVNKVLIINKERKNVPPSLICNYNFSEIIFPSNLDSKERKSKLLVFSKSFSKKKLLDKNLSPLSPHFSGNFGIRS